MIVNRAVPLKDDVIGANVLRRRMCDESMDQGTHPSQQLTKVLDETLLNLGEVRVNSRSSYQNAPIA